MSVKSQVECSSSNLFLKNMADMQQDGLKPVPDQQNYVPTNNCDPKNMQELTTYVQALLQGMQEKFQGLSDQILSRNEMGNRIDDLEKNIGDLMTQAGVDGPEK